HIWAFWDFLPTACELAGVAAPAAIDGISIVPALAKYGVPNPAGIQQELHEFLYWEFHEQGTRQAVRTGNWKAVRMRLGAPLELYDIVTDPGESHDVAANHPEVIAKIEVYLKDARTPHENWPLKARPAGATDR
ncbi:MAG: hypothetical protein SGI88_04115, partial [Candidatus Hydrogenedentes bacterium]|nr:hypothetical protein [Candidatus Hydrogenedentota bacterium]